jgi:DNA invertase Pin-like site-specific DNA recombinase
MASETPSRAKLRAAIYVRMSTEHQQYSTENQTQAIEEYAAQQNLAIVKRFADHGKSGLTLAGRASLCRLLHEVGSGAAEFENILVYDVSRWGRFQDVDESAYYEYLCKKAHIRVHYCAEPFNNDGSLYSTLMKTLKRSMAAEYSRELSRKVFAGQTKP